MLLLTHKANLLLKIIPIKGTFTFFLNTREFL